MINTITKCLGLAAFGVIACFAVSGKASAQAQGSYHCVEQVSIKQMQGQNQVSSGGSYLRQPYMVLSLGPCYNQTRNDFNANTAWSNPQTLCSRYASYGSPNGHFYVMATAYWQEMGNSAGVNRVAGYDVRCKSGRAGHVNTLPTTVTVVPTIY